MAATMKSSRRALPEIPLDEQSGLPPVGSQPTAAVVFHSASVGNVEAIAGEGLRPNAEGYVAFAWSREGVLAHGVGHAWFEFCHRRQPRAALAIADLDDLLGLDAVVAVQGSDAVDERRVRHDSELRVFERIPVSVLHFDELDYDFRRAEMYRQGLIAWLVDGARWGQIPVGTSPYHAALMLHSQSGAHHALRLDDIVGAGSDFRLFNRPPSGRVSRVGVRAGTVDYLGRVIPVMRFRSLG